MSQFHDQMKEIVLCREILVRFDIDPDMEWQQRERCIREWLNARQKYDLAIALQMAVIKAQRYNTYGSGSEFKAWVAQVTGMHYSRGYVYVRAGACLMQHGKAHLQTLAPCSIDVLASMYALTADQMRAFLHKYPEPAALLVKDAIAYIAVWADRKALPEPPPKPKPKLHQPELPGLEVLEHYDAAALELEKEGEYMGVFVERTREAFRSRLDQLTPEQLTKLDETITDMENEMHTWRQLLAGRLHHTEE